MVSVIFVCLAVDGTHGNSFAKKMDSFHKYSGQDDRYICMKKKVIGDGLFNMFVMSFR